MPTESSYRDVLRKELVERCQRNPRYSLRAFARDLDISAARLSDVINGKKGLSRAKARSLARILGMPKSKADFFCDQVDALHARSKAARERAKSKVLSYLRSQPKDKILTEDAFQVVSEWYHLAILQLMKLPRFQADPAWLARALGITSLQAQQALDRLRRLELIRLSDGVFLPAEDYVFSPDGVPSEAIKNFHKQIIHKAGDALFSQPVGSRDFLTCFFPIAIRDLPKIKAQIRKFNREICDRFSYASDADRVFSLAIQFFDLAPQLKEHDT